MANLGGNYDATNGEKMVNFSALPAGEYLCAMTRSERRESKNNPQNSYIECEFEIQDGDFKGRKIWTMLNLWNTNSTAVEIAQRELNSIMHACGKLRIEDTEELHGIPLKIKVKIRQDEQYGPSNSVTSYAPVNAANGKFGGNFGQANTAKAAPDTKEAPWE